MTAFIDRFSRWSGSRLLAWLITVNCGVFLAVWIAVMVGDSAGAESNFTARWLCVSASPAVALKKAWTVVTYMVVHYDILHLLFNMLWLLWFGRILVNVARERDLLWLFVAGGVAGAIFYVAFHAVFPGFSSESAYLCGASASALSVMTASAFKAPDMKMYMFLIGEVKLKWVAVACVLLTFAGVGGGNSGGQAAHVGGVVAGAVYFLISRSSHAARRNPHRSPLPDEPSPEVAAPRRKVTLTIGGAAGRRNVVRDGEAVARAAGGRLADSSRLDALLDKIRMSGYSSLSEMERKELNALSQRLQNDDAN